MKQKAAIILYLTYWKHVEKDLILFWNQKPDPFFLLFTRKLPKFGCFLELWVLADKSTTHSSVQIWCLYSILFILVYPKLPSLAKPVF